MRTLILNGSPRKNGDTVSLINLLIENINGEYRTINSYYADISPCIDCRCCWKNTRCAVNDGMTEIYDYVKDCDNIVIASPIYFSELTGSLLGLCSRFQAFYCSRRFLNTEPVLKGKKGGIILAGGGDGSFENAEKTAKTILKHMGAKVFFPAVCSHDTDNIPAAEDKKASEEILKLADFFNEGR